MHIKGHSPFLFSGELAGRYVKVFGETTGKVFRVVEADLVSNLGKGKGMSGFAYENFLSYVQAIVT